MESAALDTDQWLKYNTFLCIRLEAKISKAACAIYRAENQDQIKNLGNVESAKKITIPGCCQGCSQADGELLESKYKRGFTNDNLYLKRKQKQKPIKKVEKPAPDIVPAPKIKEDKMAKKKTGECIGPCGRKNIVILGRGLCSKCYYHARKDEKIHQEVVAAFIEESCLVGDGEITLLDLYDAYKKWWCENSKNEKKPLTNVEFYKELVEFKREKKGGQTYIQGISLVVEAPIRENEDVGDSHTADQPAIDPEKYKAAEAAMEKTGVKMKGPFSGLNKVPFPTNFPQLQPGERLSPVCRECGCTDLDCSVCIEKTGHPCYWVEPDLCSACVPSWIPCGLNGEILGAYDMGKHTLEPGERLVAQREDTEAALLNDLTMLEFDNVASVTKILRVGEHEIERTTVYKNESSGPSGLRGYIPAIILPIMISAAILIHPEYWRYYVCIAIQVGALFTFLESRKKKE